MNIKTSINFIFCLLFLLLFGSISFAQQSDSGPVLHLAFDNSVVDSTGFNESIVVDGGNFVEDRHGNANSAFYFDGEDDAITIEDTDSPLDDINSETGMTFMAWIKVEGFADGSWEGTIFERYDSYSDAGYYFGINRDGNIETPGYTFSTFIQINEWAHIAVVIDAGVSSVYVNGQIKEEASFNLNQASESEITLGLSRFTHRPYNGAIDDLKIYNQPVDENVIREAADLEPIPEYGSTAILDLRFNQSVTDSSVASNEMSNFEGTFVEDRFGTPESAFSLEDSSSFISYQFNEETSAFTNIEEFSVLTWLYIDSFNENGSTIIQKPTSTKSINYSAGEEITSQGFRYFITSGGGIRLKVDKINSYILEGWRVLPQDEWVHVASTFDGNNIVHYVNGVAQPTREFSNSDLVHVNGDSILIGNNETGSQGLNGAIDDLKVFNYALTKEEIKPYIDYEHSPPSVTHEKLLDIKFDKNSDNSVVPGEIEFISGEFTSDRFRENDKAYLFRSEDDQVVVREVVNKADTLSEGLTLSAWVKIHDLQISFPGSTIISRIDNHQNDKYSLGIKKVDYREGNQLYLDLNGFYIAQTDVNILRGYWIHVAGTYDGEFAKLYLNGRLIKEEPVKTKLAVYHSDIFIGDDPKHYLDLGGIEKESNSQFFGAIDDVRMYNYALDENSIAEFYEERFTGYDLEPQNLLNLSFEQSFSDSSSFNHSVIAENIGFTEDRNGRAESAASFNGENSQVIIEDTDTMIDSVSNGLTLAAWVNMKRESTDYPPTRLISRDDGNYNRFYLGLRDGYHDWRGPNEGRDTQMESVVFKLGEKTLYFRDEPVQPGEWFHVAGTFDGERMKLYLNGVLSRDEPYIGLIDVQNSDIYIGNNADGTRPFYGDLDEVQIYNYALSDSAIAAMIDIETVAVPNEVEPEVPSEFVLKQNYPNPFNPTTKIEFSLPSSGNVTLKVFNTIGHEVAVLQNGRFSAGSHTVTFDASQLSSGLYLYQLKFDGNVSTKKMLLIK